MYALVKKIKKLEWDIVPTDDIAGFKANFDKKKKYRLKSTKEEIAISSVEDSRDKLMEIRKRPTTYPLSKLKSVTDDEDGIESEKSAEAGSSSSQQGQTDLDKRLNNLKRNHKERNSLKSDDVIKRQRRKSDSNIESDPSTEASEPPRSMLSIINMERLQNHQVKIQKQPVKAMIHSTPSSSEPRDSPQRDTDMDTDEDKENLDKKRTENPKPAENISEISENDPEQEGKTKDSTNNDSAVPETGKTHFVETEANQQPKITHYFRPKREETTKTDMVPEMKEIHTEPPQNLATQELVPPPQDNETPSEGSLKEAEIIPPEQHAAIDDQKLQKVQKAAKTSKKKSKKEVKSKEKKKHKRLKSRQSNDNDRETHRFSTEIINIRNQLKKLEQEFKQFEEKVFEKLGVLTELWKQLEATPVNTPWAAKDGVEPLLPAGYWRTTTDQGEIMHVGQNIWISKREYDEAAVRSSSPAAFVKRLGPIIFDNMFEKSVTGRRAPLSGQSKEPLPPEGLLAMREIYDYYLRTYQKWDKTDEIAQELTNMESYLREKINDENKKSEGKKLKNSAKPKKTHSKGKRHGKQQRMHSKKKETSTQKRKCHSKKPSSSSSSGSDEQTISSHGETDSSENPLTDAES